MVMEIKEDHLHILMTLLIIIKLMNYKHSGTFNLDRMKLGH